MVLKQNLIKFCKILVSVVTDVITVLSAARNCKEKINLYDDVPAVQDLLCCFFVIFFIIFTGINFMLDFFVLSAKNIWCNILFRIVAFGYQARK